MVYNTPLLAPPQSISVTLGPQRDSWFPNIGAPCEGSRQPEFVILPFCHFGAGLAVAPCRSPRPEPGAARVACVSDMRRSTRLDAAFPSYNGCPETSSADEKYAKRATRGGYSSPACDGAASVRSASADSLAMGWLLAAGLLTRFYGLNWPPQVVFDELHFGKFVGGYITGRYFFDIHPPLGKLLIAAVAWWSGYDGSQPFETIGESYHPNVDVFALRVLPATFGAALPPLAYALARQLGCSRTSAALVGGLLVLDGSLLVESRLLLTDSSLFFWDLLQLLTALRASATTPNTARFHQQLALTGLAIGAAVSTKWTALANMGVVGLDSVRALLWALHAAVLAPASPYRLGTLDKALNTALTGSVRRLPPSPSPPPLPPSLPPPTTLSPPRDGDAELGGDGGKLGQSKASSGPRDEHSADVRAGACDGAHARDGACARCSRLCDAAHARMLRALPARARPLALALGPVASEFCARFFWLLALPAAIYVACMAVHIKLLPHTGRGDNFHDARFRCRLQLAPRGSLGHAVAHSPAAPFPGCLAAGCERCADVEPHGLWGAIVALNQRMLSANAGIKRGHAFGSGWKMWPLGSKPVFYWKTELPNRSASPRFCRIYMAANPFVWYVALAGSVLVLLLLGVLACRCLCGLLGQRCARRRASRGTAAGVSGVGAGSVSAGADDIGSGGSAPGVCLGGTGGGEDPIDLEGLGHLGRSSDDADGSPEPRRGEGRGEGRGEEGGCPAASAHLGGSPRHREAARQPSPLEVQMRHGWLLLAGHALAWLPFAAVERVAFLYHYIPAMLLSLLSAGLAFDLLTQRAATVRLYRGVSLRELLAVLLLALALASFVYFLPLYLGWPMEPGEMARRARRLDVWG